MNPIIQAFVNAIKAKKFTINDVPTEYKEAVQKALDENMA